MEKFKILLVDDEDSQRLPIKGFLEKKGYIVFDASSVDEAIKFYTKNHLDLIISDYKMPNKTGKELLDEIKKMNPNLPVIISTAYGDVDSAVDMMKSGAADFIQKPIDFI